jgi:ABC-2 type transport system permease protein
MKEILVIVKKDLKETVRNKVFLFSIAATVFVIFMMLNNVRNTIEALLKTNLGWEPAGYLQPIVGITIYTVALIIAVYYSFIIDSYTLVIEKTKHSLESLLCTPLSLKQFWFGKTMSMFIPSVILGFLFTVGAFCALNIFIISPKIGYWIYPGAAPLVAIFVAVPAIVLFISALFYLLQLIIANLRLINIIFMLVLIAATNTLILGPVFSTSSWSLVFISLGIAAALGLANLFLFKLLTKERIVLTSKG